MFVRQAKKDMTKMTDISNCGGYFPVIESIVHKHGLTTAMVFGVVWRACQGDKGVCYMSNESIGTACGKDMRTVMRHLDILVADGYITEQATGRTKRYYDTGKAGIIITAFDRSDKTSEQIRQNVTSDTTKLPTIKESIKELSTLTTVPSGCNIETSGETYLFEQLARVYHSKGRKPPVHWQNPIQGDQFRASEKVLGKKINAIIDKTLRGNRIALRDIVGYVVKMAEVHKKEHTDDIPEDKIYR